VRFGAEEQENALPGRKAPEPNETTLKHGNERGNAWMKEGGRRGLNAETDAVGWDWECRYDL